MTTSNLPDFSDPEYESLPIYTVAENLSLETGKSVGLWLWRMAKGACVEETSLPVLRLRPDKNWGIPKSKRQEVYKPRTSNWVNSFLTYPDHSMVKHSELVRYKTTWSIQESSLTLFLSKFNAPPVDDRDFQGIDINFKREGIVLHRTDFRSWYELSGYSPLPIFWFGEAEQAKLSPAAQAQKDESDRRLQAIAYVKGQPATSTEKNIIKALEDQYGLKGCELFDALAESGRMEQKKINAASTKTGEGLSSYKRGVIYRIKQNAK